MEPSSYTKRAGELRERQAANVAANRENRNSRHTKGDTLDASARTLSNKAKDRAKMMQAQRSVSSSVRTGAPETKPGRGSRNNDGRGGGTSVRPERRERAAVRGTPLATLLESVDLQPMLGLFEEQRITFEVLAGAADSELRELLADESLGLKLGEQQALRNGLRSVKGGGQEGSERSSTAKVARSRGLSTAEERLGGGGGEDVRACAACPACLVPRWPPAACTRLTHHRVACSAFADSGELMAG